MTVTLKPRPYGPDSTPEEIEAIRARVYVISDGIVMWDEVPVMSDFQLDLMGDKLTEITAGMKSFKMLVDITQTGIATAENRAKLRALFTHREKLERLAVFTGKNPVVNIGARFVLRAVHTKPYSMHTTKEEALAALRHGA
jgi:hypothetical protein